MYFEEIPCYTIFDEVQRSVANAILSASDTAEFLGDESYGLGDINELYGTPFCPAGKGKATEECGGISSAFN